MRSSLWILAGCVLAGLASAAVAGDSPFGETASGGAFGSDVDALDAKVELTDVQKKKIKDLAESRTKALEAYDKKMEKPRQRIEAALEKIHHDSATKNQKANAQERKKLEGYLKQIEDRRAQLNAGYDKKMFGVLKPDQRVKYNGPVLKDAMLKEFSILFLDAKQEEALTGFCDSKAKLLGIPLDPEKHAEALEPLKMQVYKGILNKKQQLEYRKMKQPIGKDKKNRKHKK